jgi:hypothetical protein
MRLERLRATFSGEFFHISVILLNVTVIEAPSNISLVIAVLGYRPPSCLGTFKNQPFLVIS